MITFLLVIGCLWVGGLFAVLDGACERLVRFNLDLLLLLVVVIGYLGFVILVCLILLEINVLLFVYVG